MIIIGRHAFILNIEEAHYTTVNELSKYITVRESTYIYLKVYHIRGTRLTFMLIRRFCINKA